MQVNVDHQVVMQFATYVGNFSKSINFECNELRAATAKLSSTMDKENIASIQNTTEKIAQILEAADPTLKDLQEKVEGFAKIVMQLNAIAKG